MTTLVDYISKRLTEFGRITQDRRPSLERLATLIAGRRATSRDTRIVFVCTHNSARSQLAEGLLRQRHGSRYRAMSAGTVARGVHPLAEDSLREIATLARQFMMSVGGKVRSVAHDIGVAVDM